MIKNLIKWLYRIICVSVVIACTLIPLGYMAASAQMAAHPDEALMYGRWRIIIPVILFVFINFIPSLTNRRYILKRHRVAADGAELLIVFMISLVLTIVSAICVYAGAFDRLYEDPASGGTIVSKIVIVPCAVLVLSIIFWNGIIRVYLTSAQLGIRHRVWGIILGWIFPANLFMLSKIIKVVTGEVDYENNRILLNRSREADRICATRYPLLMVHGVFFRDFKQGFMNYWGRIPDELKMNGAEIYYGDQQSAASVAKCGEEIADRIKKIVQETGCEKVNIIAHSKGGLDSRYAVSKCGVSDMVASITTINTPHRGCEFADYLLEKIPAPVQAQVARTYNSALNRLGDHDPDFMEAVTDLTHTSCTRMNESVTDVPGVYYQSVGSHMIKAGGGRFPLNYSFRLVKYFDGPNDGLVGEKSFEWGEKYQYLEPSGDRGISHGDMIDLNRENFDGFDVREFYVQLVLELKERGY